MKQTRPLDPLETRILGALMEKEQTTPDAYPLTVKALIAACNQKSNRDPVLDLSEAEVLDGLERLREDVLVWRSDGARVERWNHCLDRRWDLSEPAKALLTLLLLRGPQTPGELRTRSERMHRFTLPEVEATLRELAEAKDPLVRELAREPGRRERRWTHRAAEDGGVGTTEGGEGEAAARSFRQPETEPASGATYAAATSGEGDGKHDGEDERIRALEERIADLEARLSQLEELLA